jgi:tRNA pseudouridine55 synthase
MPPEPAVRAALSRFWGEIEQVPPMVSALKVGGRRLYEIAREGRTIERAPRRVRIHAIALVGWEPPRATVDIACGRGTYIRAIATDLGAALGVGGTLESLRRTRVGPFDAARAIPLDRLLREIDAGRAAEHLLPMERVLSHLPSAIVNDDHRGRLLHGQPTALREIVAFPQGLAAGDPLCVLDTSGRLLATARAAVPSGVAVSGGGDTVPFQLEHVLADAGGAD